MSNNNRQPPIKISRMEQNGTEDDYSQSLNHRNYQEYPPRRRKPTQGNIHLRNSTTLINFNRSASYRGDRRS